MNRRKFLKISVVAGTVTAASPALALNSFIPNETPAALEAINKRTIIVQIKKHIELVCGFEHLFAEFNDEITRARVATTLQPFMDNLKSGKFINSYVIVCDETNNTPQVVDDSSFVLDVLVKLDRSYESVNIRTETTYSYPNEKNA